MAASTASLSPCPHVHYYKTRSIKLNHTSHHHSLFFNSCSSSSLTHYFPLSLKPQFHHQLNDSVHDNVVVENLESKKQFHIIQVEDPPWIASLFLKGMFNNHKKELRLESREIDRRKYNALRRRQIKAETEAWEKMVEEYKDLERVMREKKLAPSLPYVKALFLGWFEPLREAIAKEHKAQQTKKHKAAFAPHIDLLPPDKMALIVMHKLMGNQDGCVQVVQAAVHIGMAIEQEVRIHSFLEKTKSLQRKKSDSDAEEDGLIREKEILRKRVNGLIKRKRLIEVHKLLKKEEMKPWGRDTQAKLGSRLIELLTETAYVQPPLDQLPDGPPDVRPAFRHRLKAAAKTPGQKIVKNYGVIECDPLVLTGLDKNAKHMLIPYVPMLVPPKRWKEYDKGGHLFLPSYVMRTHGSKKQVNTMRNIPEKQMQKVFEALDMLGNTKWRVNKKLLSVVESIWARGGNIAGLVDREDVPVPEKPSSDDFTKIQEWRWSARKVKKLNQERHSQRCDTDLKLSVARKMKDEEGFYYPHNLDFRGRAYPMHPHLNHLSSDLCRGVLEFAEGRPLGKSGLRWLKIHLANLYSGGVEKLSYDGRLAFVEGHLDDIFDSAESIPEKQMQKVFEALDMLGNTKWRVNKKLLSVVESIWARGGNIAGLVDREDVPVPEKPSSDDFTKIQEWRWSARKVKKLNQERHSQRCDTDLKLSVARKMKDEEGFYYPHNLDFRGRAYPMHPHLNHLSSDLCRGVLEFAEGRPLGKSGLRWLKIHLANLYSGGVEKLSYDGRLAFVEGHLDDIFDSAANPVNGNRWWLTAEDPLQCLAACINLSEALNSPSPHTVISHLPIHQDGSCNGLQHYAALGRDTLEAAAVNLVAGEKPADVYSEIAVRVHDIMMRDSKKDPTTFPNALLARVLVDQIDRKLVKQTVMTSVYGVTYVGAREQIKRRLEEKGLITDDRLLFTAACYAAKVTLAALGEIFQAARGIMSWLSDCAKVISSENQPVRWTTPLGLPVVQPYCKSERHLIRTSLQVLALQRASNLVDLRKQRTAFPPNFVHSLDGSHMMMTALACRDAGVRFAGVHDSFWTHACDVDQMNQILRENFVKLYSKPILENLLESFQASYPELTFPPLPERGDFDLQEVLKFPYFFN